MNLDKNSQNLIAAGVVGGAVLFVFWKMGYLSSRQNQNPILDLPTDNNPSQNKLSRAEAETIAKATYEAFDGWNFSSTNQVQVMQKLVSLDDYNLVMVANEYTRKYKGEPGFTSIRQRIESEYFFPYSAAAAVRDTLFTRLNTLNI